MDAPNSSPHPAMLAGMEELIAAMKDRPRAPEAEESSIDAAPAPDGRSQDVLAEAPWQAVGLGSKDRSDVRGAGARDRLGILEPGALMGRHLVLQRLGAGGMGAVYAAYDPQLNRKVALKLLLPGAGGNTGHIRLLREAQALARLTHPNVVGIHDVGTAGEQVWLAMELVQGKTLSTWLKEPRGWRDVVRVMRSAGKGLAAAHAAGLLHRDFKPDNVMVGDDGRVRVMDFGLVRSRPEEGLHEVVQSESPQDPETLSVRLTQAGAIVGTPRYMAPEQFGGAEVTTAADQFAFCVTLWEALYGERPFGGCTLMQIVANVLAGRRRPPPKGRAIPSRLRRACERGLSVDPQQRWPSMEALLAELRRVAAPRRWWALGIAGSLAAAGVGAWHYAETGFRCTGAQQQLAGTWDETRKQEVREAILGTGLSYAPDTWIRVEQRLDEYAQAWATQHTEVCEASSVREEQSPEVMDLRMGCLADRRIHLQEAVGVLAQADATRVEKAVELIAGLPGLSRCNDVEALQAEVPPPEDPQVVAQVDTLRQRLAQARVLRNIGDLDAAWVEAEAALKQAEELAYIPLLVEALLERSHGRGQRAEYATAEQDAEQAYLLAIEYGHSEAAAKAATQLANIVGYRQARFESGFQWGKSALALARGRRSEPEVEASSLDSVGAVLWHQGKTDDALTYYKRALAIREEISSHHPDIARSFNNIGAMLWEQGKLEEALSHHQRALVIKEEILGPRHPSVAGSLSNLGLVLLDQSKPEEALNHYQRALTIWEDALGVDHPEVADLLGNIGLVLAGQGRLEEALVVHRRALAIREEALDARHPDIATSLNNIGIVLGRQKKSEEALAYFQRALTIREEELGPSHPRVASSLNNIGAELWHQGKVEQALDYFQRALAIKEEELGPRHPSIASSLNNIGLMLQQRGKLAEALAHFRRSLVINEEALGSRHLAVADSLTHVGVVLQKQGILAEALFHYQRALAIREEALSARDSVVADSHYNVGIVLQSQRRLEEAFTHYEKALEIRLEVLGSDHPDAAYPLIRMAEVALMKHDFDTACKNAERAVSIRESSEIVPDLLAQARFVLARALWPNRSQRARAYMLAKRARDAYAKFGDVKEKEVSKVEEWLTEHKVKR